MPRFTSQTASALLAWYAIAGGVITLAGWALNVPRLTDWNNDNISMFPNTAVGVILAGWALLLLSRSRPQTGVRISVRLLSSLAGIIGGLTLLEHLTALDLGIDTLLFNRPWGQRASAAPMRMGPPASTSFVAYGVALILATYGVYSRKIASLLALGVVSISSLSLIGYWYEANQLFGIPRYTGIAWQTSTMLAGLGMGLLAAIPEHGLVSLLWRDDAGGAVARRLIVPIIGIPLLLGWLRIMGQNANLYDTAFGTSIRTVFEIILLICLLWWTADGISRQAQKAEEAARALGEANRRKDIFLATLAHELRNPLAAIGSSLEVVKIAGDEPELVRQSHEMMSRQFRQMVRLVDDLLDVGRITRDKLELRLQRVDIKSILQQSIESSRPLADAAGHKMKVMVPESPIFVHGDSVRLAQVFTNLLNNACKFTEPGGDIRIVAERLGTEAAIAVTDTGVGIAPEKLDVIFEMFSQVDNSLERAHSGLGIGLTLAKRLVEMHGGRLTVASRGPGLGSTFMVRLPLEAGSLANNPSEPPAGG